MSLVLQADNKLLTEDTKYSYLANNYASGVSTIIVINSAGFLADQYLLLGNFGSETAEIVKVSTVTGATHSVALTTSTLFAHPESTKVTIIPYNKVHFYHTTTTTYGTSTPVAAAIDIQANRQFSQIEDSTNTMGYGWFRFENFTTGVYSSESNAIPYAGAEPDSLEVLINEVMGMLNNKERTLISTDDVTSYLNEAYSIAVNELNLVNREYFSSSEQSLAITAGTSEYALPDDFSNLIYVRAGNTDIDLPMSSIAIRDIPYYLGGSNIETRYYIRGTYLGFTPAPFEDDTFYYRYRTKASRLASYSDIMALPDNGYYALRDYAMFRCCQKISNQNFASFYKAFGDWVNRQKQISITQLDEAISFGICPEALA